MSSYFVVVIIGVVVTFSPSYFRSVCWFDVGAFWASNFGEFGVEA
jgi:hypothetical protein